MYKFLKEGLKSQSGNEIWKIGEWKKYKGELKMCESGFHCSKRIYQSFSYVQGDILAEVEVGGASIKQKDKEVWSEMRIVKIWEWRKEDSVALAIYCAGLCLKNFEKVYPKDKRPRRAIEAAKLWLDGKISDKKLSAARSAARSAGSAESAARSAAWSAESAAWSAAESAARSAESAAGSAESAARSAAWSAESAAWSAARSAESAESAAGSAARSAAGSAESALITKISIWMDKRLKILKEIK